MYSSKDSATSSILYNDFDFEISEFVDGECNAAVLASPAGEVRAGIEFPISKLQIENLILRLEKALLRSGGLRRKVITDQEKIAQEFGAMLFNTVIKGNIRTLYDISRAKSYEQKRGLRIKLRIRSPELAVLPWEYMFDEREQKHLSLSNFTPIVRYLELSIPHRPLHSRLPIRILGFAADPINLPQLNVQKEQKHVEQALSRLRDIEHVELKWVTGQTIRDLQREIRNYPCHVFHFIGHGAFDEDAQEGMVFLCDEEQRARPMLASSLATILSDISTLQLVLLNSCEGSKSNNFDIFSSSASTLLRSGIPAVVSMQYEITDDASIEYTRSFYEALSDGYPIEAALSEARKSIHIQIPNSIEWGVPTLYLHTSSGMLFDFEPQIEQFSDDLLSKPNLIVNADTASFNQNSIGKMSVTETYDTTKVVISEPNEELTSISTIGDSDIEFQSPTEQDGAFAFYKTNKKPTNWYLPNIDTVLDPFRNNRESDRTIHNRGRAICSILKKLGISTEFKGAYTTASFTQYLFRFTQKQNTLPKSHQQLISKVMGYSGHIAVSVSVPSVRIIPVVPATNCWGIEVPNRNITLITPKRLFQQRAKSQRVSSIFTTFGMTVNDELVSSDLGDLPHLLIVGDDLSGKTMLLHAILMELLCTQTPETLKFLLISTKSTELNVYADIPHLLGPVITDPFIVNSALLRCIKEMEYRYELLRSAGARDLWRYNEQKRQNSEEIVPVMVLIFDDISEILDSMGGQIKANLLKLMEKSNTVGIHVVATVRMLPKTGISEQLKSKFASRIALKLKSRTASESIVNIAGAEELMGNGDMLFLKRYSSVPIRLQGCFVSEKEKSKLIKFWKNQNSNRRKTESITSTITETKNEVEIDPLFVKAISIAKEKNYVSISFLQRELRIGYNRASRIVTMMEQQGIIESNKIERSKNVKHSSNPIE